MTTDQASLRRRGGRALLGGAALTLAGCAAIAWVQATTDVASDVFSAPFDWQSGFVVFSLFAAIPHLLMLAGVAALRRTSAAGRGGFAVVMAGLALLAVCELASLPFYGERIGDTGPAIVLAGFGLGTLLVTGGMLAAGVATRRASTGTSWRRSAPLICGVLSLVVIPIQFTDALWAGVAVFALGYAVLGLALATDPAAQPALQAA